MSNETVSGGYLSATASGWSVSSGYLSWLDYDRAMATVLGRVSRSVSLDGSSREGGVGDVGVEGSVTEWEEVMEVDTMGAVLNLHCSRRET